MTQAGARELLLKFPSSLPGCLPLNTLGQVMNSSDRSLACCPVAVSLCLGHEEYAVDIDC